jgi:glycosyltransferase involved in cell wall biosynthesis/MoaA/NifB/PqqE/SkfB family radical SAM enzyme
VDDLVTVIIPAHNAARTIGRTLDSVSAQTYRDLEIIVVDDGSTDQTPTIVRTHSRVDPRIRLIRQDNAGVAAARNRGVSEARGSFVAPVDADDLWEPTKIAKQMAMMHERGAKIGLVYTWLAKIDPHDQVLSLKHRPQDEGQVFLAMCLGNIVGTGSSPLMRKHVVEECGGYDPTLRARGAQGCEDLQLYLKIAERYEFGVVKEHLTGYRRVPGNMSSDVRQMFRSRELVFSNFEAAYPQHAQVFRQGRSYAYKWLMVRALNESQFWTAGALCIGALRNDGANARWIPHSVGSALLRKAFPKRARRFVKRLLNVRERPKYFLGTAEHLAAPHLDRSSLPERAIAALAYSAPPAAPSQRKAGAERLFCSQPFTRFEVLGGGGRRGDVFFCCQSWITTSIGNMRKRSIQQIWNGREARDVRRSILDGSFRYCRADVCPYLQRVDGPVQRVEDIRDEQLLEVIKNEQTQLPFGPREVICSFDQSCNLSCPTCRPHIIMETSHGRAILDIQKRLEDEALRDARVLYITGSGDPFGSPHFFEWLCTMDTAKMPNLERIHLHTNGLLWTPRRWQTIPEKTRSLIRAATVSIDAATAETYAVNRRGGDFETLLQRLAFISGLRRNGPLAYLEIHMTVQANNFQEMPLFARLGRGHDCDRVSFHQLLDWGSFSPAEYAARAIQLPSHPQHQALLEQLRDETLEDPIVYLSNLTHLLQRSSQIPQDVPSCDAAE